MSTTFTLPPPPAKTATKATSSTFSLATPKASKAMRTAIYGTGGVGKTTLACHAKGAKAFIDLDGSIPVLWPQLEAQGVAKDIKVVSGIDTWDTLLAALEAPIYGDVDVIIIDTLTKAQELASAWVPLNIKGEKGQVYKTLEDYPFGQGPGHLYETFLRLFSACDKLVAQGKSVILICHEGTSTVPNPEGAEFIQYSPNLSNPKSGKGSIRLKLKDWVDNLFFIQNGKVIDKDGKASGTNQRIVYPVDQAWAMAKSRVIGEQFSLTGYGDDMWKVIQG